MVVVVLMLQLNGGDHDAIVDDGGDDGDDYGEDVDGGDAAFFCLSRFVWPSFRFLILNLRDIIVIIKF